MACDSLPAAPAKVAAATAAVRAAPQVAYLVDNSQIRSSAKGITFRRSPQLEDKDMTMLARWTSVVHGVDVGDSWVQVGDRFLPTQIGGVQVLFRQAAACSAGGGGVGDAPQVLSQKRASGRQREEPSLGTVPELQEGPASAPAPGSRRRRTSQGGVRRDRHDEAAGGPAERRPAGGHSVPLDLRGLSKLLTGNAVKTPRQ